MEPLLSRLAEARQVIAVEQQGHGRTADADRPLTYEQMADDTAALSRRLELGSADVVVPPGSGVLDRADWLHAMISLFLPPAAGPCEHVEDVRTDWGPVSEPVCEECARAGETSWVSLRRCLTCGHVGCCDSSPGLHATGHHRETGHPTVQSLQPGQDWVWCYVDELTMRHVDGDWVEVDLFFEAGIAYMRDHVQAGGEPTLDESFTMGKGFPLGSWVAEMRRRNAAGDLTTDQTSQIDELPGWRWDG